MLAPGLFVAGAVRKAAWTRCPGKRRKMPPSNKADADMAKPACAWEGGSTAMMLGHHGKGPTLPGAKSTAGPTRQTFRTDTKARTEFARAGWDSG